MAAPPLDPGLFHGLKAERPHFCCGSEAPLLRAMQGVFDTYAGARAEGAAGRRILEQAKETTRERIAALLGQPAKAANVAFAPSTGHALDIVARSLDWRAREEIVVLAEDFPSVIMAWRSLAERGATARTVAGGDTPEDALIEAVGPDTRAVCVSHVNWRTSRRVDLPRLSAALRPRGVRLIVDAAHSLGVLPVPGELCDAVVACGHKFLLGMHGIGILFWNDLPDPASARAPAGWYSLASMDRYCADGDMTFKPDAAAFEPGNPAFICILALGEGLATLQRAGLDAISHHAAGLAGRLADFLAERGVPVLTPIEAGRRGTSIAIPDPQGARLAEALREAGILAAHGVGRLRVSFHGFTSENDLDRLTTAISAAL